MALQQLQQTQQPRSFEFPPIQPPIPHHNRRLSYPVTPFSSDIWLYNSSSASNSSSSRASMNGSPLEKHLALSPPKFGSLFGRKKETDQSNQENDYDPFMFENDALAKEMVNILKIE